MPSFNAALADVQRAYSDSEDARNVLIERVNSLNAEYNNLLALLHDVKSGVISVDDIEIDLTRRSWEVHGKGRALRVSRFESNGDDSV